MKKFVAISTALGYLITAGIVRAQSPSPISINLPTNFGVPGNTEPGDLIANALKIIFLVASLVVLFMLVIGAFQWITSGGDKEAVGKARGRITHALIGLAILALAVLIVTVVARLLNINTPFQANIPTLVNKP